MHFLRHSCTALGTLVLLAGCGSEPRTTVPGAEMRNMAAVLPFESPERTSWSYRMHMVEFSVEGHPPLAHKKSSLDMGVRKIVDGAKVTCEILPFRKDVSYAEQPWAPIDFYTNAATADEALEPASHVGERDVYYPGDDNDRNGERASHLLTRWWEVKRDDSLRFSERRLGPSDVSFLMSFTRGALRFQMLANFATRPDGKGECRAMTRICTDIRKNTDGTHSCVDGGFNRELWKIITQADRWGALRDSVMGVRADRDRNDLKSLDAVVRDLDAEGNPVGDFYRTRLAAK